MYISSYSLFCFPLHSQTREEEEEEPEQIPLGKIRFPSVLYRHMPEGQGQQQQQPMLGGGAGEEVAVQKSLKDMSLREQVGGGVGVRSALCCGDP
jgi:hypothetical protein